MHARQPRNDNAQKRRLDSLRHRCLQRAQQKRQELLLTTRLQPGGRSPAAADAAHWREIVHAELNAVGRSERAAGAAWSDVDEALLQQQLGTDGYLELMMATEEALVRELDADLAQLGADGRAPSSTFEPRSKFSRLAQANNGQLVACGTFGVSVAR